MKVLLGCVNSTVSLVGYDLSQERAFWYCPGNVLRVCGICTTEDALWVSSDNTLTRLGANGITPPVLTITLPGPHENLAHSVKTVGDNFLAVADTGNSRICILAEQDRKSPIMSYNPLEEWDFPLPQDAIHLNDMIPWKDGILASAFHHQPFQQYKQHYPAWNTAGLGVLFFMQRKNKRTITRIVASGLNCPHSLAEHEQRIYCCSSSTGEFYCFAPAEHGSLHLERVWQISTNHFLRGCLRLPNAWLLGGSSRRHAHTTQADTAEGMCLFRLSDDGTITQYRVAGAGEIYDIIPWQADIMGHVAATLLTLPYLPLEGIFPPRCSSDML